jgi:uncharacterized protein (TIGR03032 family)
MEKQVSKDLVNACSTLPWWDIDENFGESRVRVDASDDFKKLLRKARASLLIASRQNSKVATLYLDDDHCYAATTSLPNPMGMALSGGSLAIGAGSGIHVYQKIHFSKTGKAIFFPTSFHYTGEVSIHDVAWSNEGQLWFLNTLFSSLCTIDLDSHFRARWTPSFVDEFGPFDACHLNGMALPDEAKGYFTALAKSTGLSGWRKFDIDDGILMDRDSNIIAANLSLPHSPTMVGDNIWLLEAGRGSISCMGPNDSTARVINKVQGVVRGMQTLDDHVLVGSSKIRKTSGIVTDQLTQRLGGGPESSKLYAISVETGSIAGYADIPFLDEISSITTLPYNHVILYAPQPNHMSSTYIFRPISS